MYFSKKDSNPFVVMLYRKEDLNISRFNTCMNTCMWFVHMGELFTCVLSSTLYTTAVVS